MGSHYRLPKSFHIHINNRIPEFTNTFTHSRIPAFFLSSMWVLRAFFAAATHHLKINILHKSPINNRNFMIFNPKSNDLSATIRRSLGDPFITTLHFPARAKHYFVNSNNIRIFAF